MEIRQSTLATYMECSLRYKFQQEGAPREQSSAMSFGTVLHECVLLMETAYDLQVGLDRFTKMWANLDQYTQADGTTLDYSYLLPRNRHDTYRDLGINILREWWTLIQWESDVVLGREYWFKVPLGNHTLTGTIDKLALRPQKDGSLAVLVSDYKTGAKTPTRDYLHHNIQFHAYCYATTQPEFWENMPDGVSLFEKFKDAPRVAEWVHLRGPKRIDAGPREQFHYNRLLYAVDAIEQSDAYGIYVPTISGTTCEFCEFRKVCGLPSRAQEGLEVEEDL